MPKPHLRRETRFKEPSELAVTVASYKASQEVVRNFIQQHGLTVEVASQWRAAIPTIKELLQSKGQKTPPEDVRKALEVSIRDRKHAWSILESRPTRNRNRDEGHSYFLRLMECALKEWFPSEPESKQTDLIATVQQFSQDQQDNLDPPDDFDEEQYLLEDNLFLLIGEARAGLDEVNNLTVDLAEGRISLPTFGAALSLFYYQIRNQSTFQGSSITNELHATYQNMAILALVFFKFPLGSYAKTLDMVAELRARDISVGDLDAEVDESRRRTLDEGEPYNDVLENARMIYDEAHPASQSPAFHDFVSPFIVDLLAWQSDQTSGPSGSSYPFHLLVGAAIQHTITAALGDSCIAGCIRQLHPRCAIQLFVQLQSETLKDHVLNKEEAWKLKENFDIVQSLTRRKVFETFSFDRGQLLSLWSSGHSLLQQTSAEVVQGFLKFLNKDENPALLDLIHIYTAYKRPNLSERPWTNDARTQSILESLHRMVLAKVDCTDLIAINNAWKRTRENSWDSKAVVVKLKDPTVSIATSLSLEKFDLTKNAKRKLGQYLNEHRPKTVVETMRLVVKALGMQQDLCVRWFIFGSLAEELCNQLEEAHIASGLMGKPLITRQNGKVALRQFAEDNTKGENLVSDAIESNLLDAFKYPSFMKPLSLTCANPRLLFACTKDMVHMDMKTAEAKISWEPGAYLKCLRGPPLPSQLPVFRSFAKDVHPSSVPDGLPDAATHTEALVFWIVSQWTVLEGGREVFVYYANFVDEACLCIA